MIQVVKKPSEAIQDKITLWLNHLLVLYTFLIPINNNAKSSLFFVMLVLFLYRRDYWKYLKEVFSNRIVQACLLFYAINAFGLVYTENIEYGKDHMDRVKYLLFPLLFLSFLDVRFAFRIITAFILGMLVAELFSYLIHFGIFPYEFFIGQYEIWETQAYSPAPFMAHSDHNVGLALVVAILLYQLLNKEKLTLFIKVGSLLFITTATINMSFIASRTGYVLYLLIILVVILLTFRKNIFKILSLTLIVLFGLSYFAYNYSNTVNSRVNQTIESINKILNNDDYQTSVGARIGFTKYSLGVIKENFLYGVGTGDHMDEVRAIIPEKHNYFKDPKFIGKPHNVYIQILLQLGIVGFLFFCYLIYTIITYKHVPKYNKDIMFIITFATLIFMLPGMLYGSFELPLWMVFICAMIVQKKQNIEVEAIDRKLIIQYLGWITLFLIIGITR